MIEIHDNPKYAWKCADCGFIYGGQNQNLAAKQDKTAHTPIDLGATVTILRSDYEGLQGICRHYHDTLKRVETQRDQLRDLADTFAVTGARSVEELARWRTAIAQIEGNS